MFRKWNQPAPPFHLIGNIYYVGASDITSFLITTKDGLILLDGGFVETAPMIRKNIATLGFRVEDVRILLNSHAHLDHAGGLAELKRASGAKLYASKADSILLAKGGRGDFHFKDRSTYPPVEVDKIIEHEQQISLGEVTVKAYITPGHTRGCTTWTMQIDHEGVAWNVVFLGSVTVPGYKLVNNAEYPEIADDYRRSFRILKSLPCDIFLAAHGSFFSLSEKSEKLKSLQRIDTELNPFLDPDGYRSFLTGAEDSFARQMQNEKAQSGSIQQ